MDIQIEQECPQCGGKEVLSEAARFFCCSYCGVGNFISTDRLSRLFLPPRLAAGETPYLLAPYLRFKGTVFVVSSGGISHKVIDTTQLAVKGPKGFPPSLGVRPQAMKLQRIAPELKFTYLARTLEARAIFDKVVSVSNLIKKEQVFHLCYIGETINLIYLPLAGDDDSLRDAVTRNRICTREKLQAMMTPGATVPYRPDWDVKLLPSLCPSCGWALEEEQDGAAVICENCARSFEIQNNGMQPVRWQMVEGDNNTGCYLPFWFIDEEIEQLGIRSFGDFVKQCNLPMAGKAQWQHRAMQFVIPAFKIRPKSFLRAARQATINQWRVSPGRGRRQPGFFPATLPSKEGIQSVKSILAACAVSRKKVFPYLPDIRIKAREATLTYLPFSDKGHDWVQPQTGIVVGKNNLRFGRSM